MVQCLPFSLNLLLKFKVLKCPHLTSKVRGQHTLDMWICKNIIIVKFYFVKRKVINLLHFFELCIIVENIIPPPPVSFSVTLISCPR
jgi:hypothetical protein